MEACQNETALAQIDRKLAGLVLNEKKTSNPTAQAAIAAKKAQAEADRKALHLELKKKIEEAQGALETYVSQNKNKLPNSYVGCTLQFMIEYPGNVKRLTSGGQFVTVPVTDSSSLATSNSTHMPFKHSQSS